MENKANQNNKTQNNTTQQDTTHQNKAKQSTTRYTLHKAKLTNQNTNQKQQNITKLAIVQLYNEIGEEVGTKREKGDQGVGMKEEKVE